MLIHNAVITGSLTFPTALPISGSLLVSGSVGIGATNPQYLTDIRGPYDAAGILSVRSTNTATIDVGGVLGFGGFHNGSSNQSQWAAIKGAKENSNVNDNASYLSFGTQVSAGSITEKVRISSAGTSSFGGTTISTAADAASITIKQPSTTHTNGIYLERSGERNGYYMYVGGAVDSLTFRRNYFGTQSDVMSLTRDGNVGIGMTNPSKLFQVSGSAEGQTAGISGLTYGIRFDNGGAFAFGGSAIHGVDKTLTSTYQPLAINGSSLIFGTAGTERVKVGGGDSILYGLSAGVDGTYQPAIGMMYTANNNETNVISTAVSSVAAQSGFRFDVSNGAGSSARTTSMYINRSSVSVVGSLSKGSGTFKIDHPLESKKDTHHLVHSFIEGPKADLIYRGKVILVNGIATINIDEFIGMTEGTFEALCRDVQCFTTNESGWDLIKGKVEGNILTITSQNTESTDEISWMVIGERKDRHMFDTEWTDENGRPILEPLKPTPPTPPVEENNPTEENNSIGE